MERGCFLLCAHADAMYDANHVFHFVAFLCSVKKFLHAAALFFRRHLPQPLLKFIYAAVAVVLILLEGTNSSAVDLHFLYHNTLLRLKERFVSKKAFFFFITGIMQDRLVAIWRFFL
jgi:hypothetical protein